MLLKTHIFFNLFFFFLFHNFLKIDFSFFIIFLLFLLGSIIPDIDSKFSKIGKKKIFRPIQFFIKHRGITHSLFFVILFFLIPFIPRNYKIWFCFGFILHMFLDALTINGIYLFYPFKFKIRGFIRTGKLIEKSLFFLFITLDFFIFLFKLIIL
jgi:inner membrane protein